MSYRFRNRQPRPGTRPGLPLTAVPPPPGPEDRPTRRRLGPRTVLCQLLVCLTVTLGLSSSHLEATASSQPFGTERSLTLAVARPLHRLAEASGLDRPDRALARLLGRATDEPDTAPTVPLEAAAGASERPAEADSSRFTGDGPTSTSPAAGSAVSGAPATGGEATADPARYGPPRPDDAATVTTGTAAATATGDPASSGVPGPLSPPPGPTDGAPATTVSKLPAPPGPAAAATPAPTPGLGPAVVDPVPEPGPARAVTPEARLRLWAGGDSLGEYVGNQLLAPLSDRQLTAVDLDFHIGTGLTRPDTYDWQARIDEVMARPEPPEALVFMVGGNDNQPMRAGGQNLAVGSGAWLAEYRARVVDIMDSTRPQATRPGPSHLWWIGLPPMRDGERDGLARSIDAILAEEAAGRPWVTFVDLVPRFSGPDGGFAGTITGPDGKAKVARAPDGIHITYAGSTWIAEDLWADVTARWGL